MSCWVVPSVAAELWGCTLDAVLSAVRNGHVPTKDDAGWTFVNIAPDSPQVKSRPARPKKTDSQTSLVVSRAEEQALHFDEHSEIPDDWRAIRASVSASRRAPHRKAA